jgi:DNA-binding LacI/PurR family transcriptional regulator
LTAFSTSLSAESKACSKNNNYRILLIFKNDKFVENKEYLRLFRENSVDGLLVWGARFNDNYREEAGKYNLLLINSHCEHYDSLSYIGHDNVAAARAITRDLISQGHRKIIYIGGSEEISIIRERFEGYKMALAEAGMPLRPELCFSGDIDRQAINRIAEEIATGKLTADAIQCVSDGLALHCGYSLISRGYRIPEDIVITGGDRIEDEYAAMTDWKFPLPTFSLDSFHMGELAAEKLLQKINGDNMPPIRELLPVELVYPQTVKNKFAHKALTMEGTSCPTRELIPV